MADTRVTHQRSARCAAGSGDDIAHARRNAGLQADIGQHQRGQRRLLGRLGNDGASGGQCRREAARRGGQWVIPGNDVGGDANGFVERVGQIVRTQRDAVALVFVARAGIVLKAVGGACDVAQRLDQALAGVQRFRDRQSACVRPDQLGHPVKDPAALRRRHRPPASAERLARTVHRPVHVALATGCKSGEGAPGAGVHRFHRRAVQRWPQCAVDEMAAWQAGQGAGGLRFAHQAVQFARHLDRLALVVDGALQPLRVDVHPPAGAARKRDMAVAHLIG